MKSPRLDYTLDVFSELLGVSFVCVNSTAGATLIYADEGTDQGLHIRPYPLLTETDIQERHKDAAVFEPWLKSWCCYKTGGEIPFDLFSAAFFLLSRYEEHLDFFEDEHQRFTARESVLFQQDLLQEPLINQWALQLQNLLSERFPDLKFAPRSFEYISTLDIDQAWKYRYKGIKRNIAGFLRDFLAGKWENFKERCPVIFRMKQDPFFNFDWQDQVHKEYHIPVKYFMLLGNLGPYDKNINWKVSEFQKLMRRLDSNPQYQLGIHPSYASNEFTEQSDNPTLQAEIKRLEVVLKRNVNLSRQHFLMHQFPATYNQLLKENITEEHSMGYSSVAGFRAGIAAPFHYFDLSKNCSTSLLLYPFCLMDITPLHYMNLDVDQALDFMEGLMTKVHEVGGLFISLWHNESLGETERWKNWRSIYERMIKKAYTLINS